jgi:hypothetical protein
VAETDWANTLLNSATLIAALGAVYFSHRSLQLQRRQKLADYRRDWIEDLRSHLADFSAAAYRRRIVWEQYKSHKKAGKAAELPGLVVQYIEYTEVLTRHDAHIRLSLNEDEAEHKELLDQLKLHKEKKYDEIEQSPAKFSSIARRVLKTEWERLKNEL